MTPDDEVKIKEQLIERIQANLRDYCCQELEELLPEMINADETSQIFYLKGKIDMINHLLEGNYDFMIEITPEHKLENPDHNTDSIFDFGVDKPE